MDSTSTHTSTPNENTPLGGPAESVYPKLLPELATFGVLAAIQFDALPQWLDLPMEDTVAWLVALEAATLFLMFTLVDVATRMRRPPPWWLGIAVVVGLVIIYPDVIALVVAGWQLGLWVFLPLLWSLMERFRELWTLPDASRIERFRRRALSNGRVASAVVISALFIATLLIHAALQSGEFDPDVVIYQYGVPLLAVFYLLAAFDAWRVHRPAFGIKPRSLWPFLDMGDTDRVDPL